MWNLSKEVKEKFLKCTILPIHESDEDWEHALRDAKEEGEDLIARLKEELEEVKDELLRILPNRFIHYVDNGTLNQPSLPKTVREDYLQWVQEAYKKFEQILDAAYENTKQSVTFLSSAVQDVFAESLHDSTIERIEREGDTLHLYINTDGGFSSKSHVHFIFQNVTAEKTDEPIQVGQWLIYYELQKTVDGFAFRVLFDCPDSEWTITMKSMDAEYYYRPVAYATMNDEGKVEETSLSDYVSQLDPDYRYWLITPHVTCAIKTLSENMTLENGKIEFGQNEMVVITGNERFTYKLVEYNPIKFIYTDVYEDPYAHFSEPVPRKEIEAAAFSDELELQVRAWNTMYANPNELAEIINRVLSKIEISNENEMMISVYVSHFFKKGILTEAVVEKYHKLID
ncbi:DUF4085 family protein [Neobacillus niacini]|uniref:DUF4085 family protein n=1 Tax=Neobacillus niacini TaxID=86668 RepID=UPI0030009F10